MAIKYKNPVLKELSDKSDFLGTSMGMTRKVSLSIWNEFYEWINKIKVLRWGRPIGISYNIFKLFKSYKRRNSSADEFDKTNNGFYFNLKIFADLNLVLYFLFDHVLFLTRVSIFCFCKFSNKIV